MSEEQKGQVMGQWRLAGTGNSTDRAGGVVRGRALIILQGILKIMGFTLNAVRNQMKFGSFEVI